MLVNYNVLTYIVLGGCADCKTCPIMRFFSKKPKPSLAPLYDYIEPGLCRISVKGRESTIVLVAVPPEIAARERFGSMIESIAGRCQKAVTLRLKRKIGFNSPGVLQPWLQHHAQHDTVLKAFGRSRCLDNLVAGQLGRTESYLCLVTADAGAGAEILAELKQEHYIPVAPEHQREVLAQLVPHKNGEHVAIQLSEDSCNLANVLHELQSFKDLNVVSQIEWLSFGVEVRCYVEILDDDKGKTAENLANILNANGINAAVMGEGLLPVDLDCGVSRKKKRPSLDCNTYQVDGPGNYAMLSWPLETAVVARQERSLAYSHEPGLLLYTPDNQLHSFAFRELEYGCLYLTYPGDVRGLRAAQAVVSELTLAQLMGSEGVQLIGGRPMPGEFLRLLGSTNVHLTELSEQGLNPFTIRADNDRVFELVCSLFRPLTQRERETMRVSFDDVLAGHFTRNLRGLQQAMQRNTLVEDDLRDELLLLLNGPYGSLFMRDVSPEFSDRLLQLTWCPMMQKALPTVGIYLLKLLRLLKPVVCQPMRPLMVLQNPQQWLGDEEVGYDVIRSMRVNGIHCVVVQPEAEVVGLEERMFAAVQMAVSCSRKEPLVDIYGSDAAPLLGARLVLDNFAGVLHE